MLDAELRELERRAMAADVDALIAWIIALIRMGRLDAARRAILRFLMRFPRLSGELARRMDQLPEAIRKTVDILTKAADLGSKRFLQFVSWLNRWLGAI